MADEKSTVVFETDQRFVRGGRLFGPGKWDVDPEFAQRLVDEELGSSGNLKPAPKKSPDEVPGAEVRAPVKKVKTPLPDNFPERETLAKAGFKTIESLQVDDVEKKLAEVEGLGPAKIAKIGQALP